MKSVGYGIILCLFFLTSCEPGIVLISSSTSKPPDAKEVLTLEPDADILQWDGAIYQAGVEWVQELELTKKERIGEILYNTQMSEEFQDGIASKLPIGSIMYSTDEGDEYILVEVDEETRSYLLLSEG